MDLIKQIQRYEVTVLKPEVFIVRASTPLAAEAAVEQKLKRQNEAGDKWTLVSIKKVMNNEEVITDIDADTSPDGNSAA